MESVGGERSGQRSQAPTEAENDGGALIPDDSRGGVREANEAPQGKAPPIWAVDTVKESDAVLSSVEPATLWEPF